MRHILTVIRFCHVLITSYKIFIKILKQFKLFIITTCQFLIRSLQDFYKNHQYLEKKKILLRSWDIQVLKRSYKIFT